jgi:hypothetical protein
MNQTPQRNNFAADYIDVATRIAEFRTKYPEGSLRPFDPTEPVKIITFSDGKTFLQYIAVAYRDPHDAAPGIGVAWEPFPGKSPFTRDSEAMVAETSAWGRAIVAALAADTKKGIASAEEVRVAKSRQAAPQPAAAAPTDGQGWESTGEELATPKQVVRIGILRKELNLDDDTYHSRLRDLFGVASAKLLTQAQAEDLIGKLAAANNAQRTKPSLGAAIKKAGQDE